MRKYTVIDSDGDYWGDYDSMAEAIARADEVVGHPTSPESRRANPRRIGHVVYAVDADGWQNPHGAQVNQNY